MRLARQAEQITADIPGWIARTWQLLADRARSPRPGTWPTPSAAARPDWPASRDTGDLWALARLLTRVVTWTCRRAGSRTLRRTYGKGSRSPVRTGGWVELRNLLDCCGYLCVATGRRAEALTVWAASDAFMQHQELSQSRPRRRVAARRRCARPGRRSARPGTRGRGTRRGDEPGHGSRVRPDAHRPGPQPPTTARPEALSARERELVTLVAHGRTDAQIAAQLYISIRTVRSHLDRIRDKTGCRRRADLTRLALSAELI